MSKSWFNSPNKGTPTRTISAGTVHYLFPKRPAASARAVLLLACARDRLGPVIDIPEKPKAYKRAMERLSSLKESPFSALSPLGNRPFAVTRTTGANK